MILLINGLEYVVVKFFADGALGERTAALREPYTDDPENKGMLINSEEWFINMFTKAHAMVYKQLHTQ